VSLRLNNDLTMPALGLGVFQTPPEETAASVETALRIGYRLIDTAAAYGNEREVAEGIRRSGIARDEVFLETKVWISDYGHGATLHAFEKSAGAVTSAIIGPRTMEQLDSQLPAADVTLDAALLDRIDEIVRPGVNLNPADTSYGEQVLEPSLRRR
jgi:aryl-alcohol dehydrogenase-like predicted oxidoreductase